MATHGRLVEYSETVEFRLEPHGAVALGDLASSFGALDKIYNRMGGGPERLSVTSLRSGSIIAEVAPYIPLLAATVPYLGHAVTLSDFVRKFRKALDGFAEIKTASSPPSPVEPEVAAEIAEVLKPLAGRKGAAFSMAHICYRSRSGDRTVEFEASYDSAAIDRAVINANRFVEESTGTAGANDTEQQEDQNLLRSVAMTLHQANRGPAKSRGQTGDRGVVEAVSDKPLPVYFAGGISRLKDRMVRSARNPLKYVYIVDVWVHRQGGHPKSYTVVEVHKAAEVIASRETPDLLRTPRRRISRRSSGEGGT